MHAQELSEYRHTPQCGLPPAQLRTAEFGKYTLEIFFVNDSAHLEIGVTGC